MLTRRNVISFSSLLLSLFFSISFSQDNSNGDPAEIKRTILNSNNTKIVIYNTGELTRALTLSGTADLVWRGLGYMFEFGPLLAANVVNDQGDTLHIVDDACWLPVQGDYSPDGSLKWGWLPRAGYARSGQTELATSNNPNSWPTSWNTWPGEFGDGVVIGQNEAYYAMDDFTNKEFAYYPFPSDTNKRGFGVSAEVRTYQFGGNLSDAIIIKWKLKNESPRALNKCYFGFYGDPHIGGSFDFNDDRAYFIGPNGPVGDPVHSLAGNTVYVWDEDGRGGGGLPTGYLSFKFLQTPNNLDRTSLSVLPYTNSIPNVPKNDSLMWSILSSPTDTTQLLLQTPGDNILVFGTGPFSLAPGDSTTVSLAIFLSDTYQDMLDDATYIYFASHWPNIGSHASEQGGDPNYTISLTSPNSGIVSGNVPVTWQYTGTDPNAKVLIECSWDNGTSWQPVVWEHSVVQPFSWNTSDTRDGVNYLLRIVAYSSDYTHHYYDISNERFTVNNALNAQPELAVDFSFEGTALRTPPLNISWVSEDADNSALTVSLFASYAQSGPYFLIHSASYPSGSQSYAWDFSSFPNGTTCFIKVVASDGTLDSTLMSRSFSINQEVGHYQPATFQHVAGNGTPDLELQVVDPAQLTGHTYEAYFTVGSDTLKKVFVKDVNTGLVVVNNYALMQGTSTPLFDGLKLTIDDKQADINVARSKFNRSVLDSTVNFTWGNLFFNRVKVPLDWFIAFHSLDTLPNGHYVYPGDTVLNNSGRKAVVCPFRLQNIDSNQTGNAIVQGALADSLWKPGRPFILRPQVPVGGQVCYQVNMNFTSLLRPTFGDTLWIFTDKPITSRDVFRFVADSSYVTGVSTGKQPLEFALFNNYPNPFNPETTIRYQLAQPGRTTLKVFDILGREVQTLVDEVQSSGIYTVHLNASGLSSGVYFYRIEAGTFTSVKKMILLR